MQVASLELCRELFELSGWEFEYWYWAKRTTKHGPELKHPVSYVGETFRKEWGDIPAYDLGYLLRKLPGHVALTSTTWDDVHTERPEGQQEDYQAVACYQSNIKGVLVQEVADTPEDAACKLSIELFKQRVLKKEAHHE